MLRRHVTVAGGQGAEDDTNPSYNIHSSRVAASSRHSRGFRILLSPPVLLTVAIVLTILTYLPNPLSSSSTLPRANDVAQHAVRAEHELATKMRDWWQHPDAAAVAPDPPTTRSSEYANLNAASRRMLQQDAKWVDGEKKLKARLKILAAMQAQGQMIGVPVLTRWLGDDFPVWVGEKGDWDEQTWRTKVQEEYDRMRKEEEEWRNMIREKFKDEL